MAENLFPKTLPELSYVVLSYMDALTRLGHILMEGISLSLNLEPDYFAKRYTGDPLTLFRIFHYPPPQGNLSDLNPKPPSPTPRSPNPQAFTAKTSNSKPKTRNTKPQTRNPKPKPKTLQIASMGRGRAHGLWCINHLEARPCRRPTGEDRREVDFCTANSWDIRM